MGYACPLRYSEEIHWKSRTVRWENKGLFMLNQGPVRILIPGDCRQAIWEGGFLDELRSKWNRKAYSPSDSKFIFWGKFWGCVVGSQIKQGGHGVIFLSFKLLLHSPFTFNVITDMVRFMSAILNLFFLCLKSFLFFSSLLPSFALSECSLVPFNDFFWWSYQVTNFFYIHLIVSLR